MKIVTALSAVSIVALTAMPAGAAEQNFKRDRNISVTERPRPDYDPAGLHTGSFLILPKATLSVVSDDNIFAEPTNEDSDVILRARLEAQARSTWSRHRLEVHGWTQFNNYSDHSSENTTDYNLGLSGQLDINRFDAIGAGADYSRLSEARTDPTAPTAASEPIQYTRANVFISGVKEFNRLRLLGRLDRTQLNFHNDSNVLVPLQDYRDRTVSTAVARAEYAVSPATALYVEAAFNDRDYKRLTPGPVFPFTPFDRSSKGTEVSVGANFELSSLTRGEIQVGHVSQDYKAFPTIKAATVHGKVEWFPTQLVTVTFTGDRSVQDASTATQSGYIATTFAARADYELLRNLILSGEVGHENDDFKGASRKDKTWRVGAGATWLINRNIGMRLTLDHLDRDSSGALPSPDYEINRVGLALVLQR